MLRMDGVDKPRWLFHKHLLLKITVQKCITNIKLPNRPSKTYCQREYNTYRDGLDNRTKGVKIIKAVSLCEPRGHQSSFMTINHSIRQKLKAKNPFATYRLEVDGRRHESPCAFAVHCINFRFHCGTPLQTRQCTFIWCWFNLRGRGKDSRCPSFWFEDAHLGAGDHMMLIWM